MKKMIRVLQVFDSIEASGGVQAVIMNAYRNIDKKMVQFDFACYHDSGKNTFREEIESLGGKVINIKCLSEAGLGEFYKQFVRICSENKYDAVHAHNIHHNGIILLAAKKAGVKNRISHAHQSFDEFNSKSYRRIIAKCFMILNLHVATKFVACSDQAARFLYGSKHRYIFIPNAIDLSIYKRLPTRNELRQKYGISEDEKILIHIGRMAVPKNQIFLIDIIDQLRDSDWKLWLIGDGELKQNILEYIQQKNLSSKIEYLGIRADCPQLLKIANIMLLPSVYEGLPVTAVEAQAAGCYCLLSDVITKQVDVGTQEIEYISIDNSNKWAERILSFDVATFSDSARQNNIMQLQRAGFDSETNVAKWYELYYNE